MKNRFILYVLILLCNVSWCDYAKPKIGLVLSGGGARGFAHIGVLKVLEKYRIPVDCIAGTSMGAIIGGLYSAGVSPEEMEKEMLSLDWKELFSNRPSMKNASQIDKQDFQKYPVDLGFGLQQGQISLPRGILEGQKIELELDLLLSHLASNINFDNLPVRFRAIATDIETGDMKVFSSGDLSKVIRASMSIPGVFLPVEIDGRMYIDGGIVRNLPVDIVKQMGVDVVIAVNVGSPLMKRDQLNSFVDVSFQILSLFGKMNDKQQLDLLGPGDILIVPDLQKVNISQFDNAYKIIQAGVQSAELEAKKLSRYSVSESEYAVYKEKLLAFRHQHQTIASIRINNDSSIADTVISKRLKIKVPGQIDKKLLKDAFDRVYGLGVFQSIDFSIEKEGENRILRIDTKKKSWGTDSFSFGFGIFDDFHVSSEYLARFGYFKREINNLGGVWRNEISIGRQRSFTSAFFQPVSYDGRFFVMPSIGIKSESFNVFNSGRRIAKYDSTFKKIGLCFGFQAEKYAAFTTELSAGNLSVSPLIGSKTLEKDKPVKSDLTMRFLFNSLDSNFAPSRGIYFDSIWQHAWKYFGGDNSYDKLQTKLMLPFSKKRNTFIIDFESGTDLGTEIPFYDRFSIGGFFNLSGVPYDYYRCDRFTKASGIYMYKFHLVPPLYLGMSLEAAKVHTIYGYSRDKDFRISGSVFFAMDTPMGPLYLGYGTSGDMGSLYLIIGNP